MRNKICYNCEFYYKNKTDYFYHKMGLCCVNPPQLLADHKLFNHATDKIEPDLKGYWPYVSEDEWCGRFLDKKIKSDLEGE